MKKIKVRYECAEYYDGTVRAFRYCTYMKYGQLIGEPCITKSNAKRSFIRVCAYLSIPIDIFEFED